MANPRKKRTALFIILLLFFVFYVRYYFHAVDARFFNRSLPGVAALAYYEIKDYRNTQKYLRRQKGYVRRNRLGEKKI